MFIYWVRLDEIPCSFSCRSQSQPVLSGLFCLTTCYQASRPWEDKRKMISYHWSGTYGAPRRKDKTKIFSWHDINPKPHLTQRGNNTCDGTNPTNRVPVDEAHGVDSIQSQHHLSSVKARPFLWDIIVAHQIHQVTPWHVLHHHVEVAVILECKKELRKRRTVKWGTK